MHFIKWVSSVESKLLLLLYYYGAGPRERSEGNGEKLGVGKKAEIKFADFFFSEHNRWVVDSSPLLRVNFVRALVRKLFKLSLSLLSLICGSEYDKSIEFIIGPVIELL